MIVLYKKKYADFLPEQLLKHKPKGTRFFVIGRVGAVIAKMPPRILLTPQGVKRPDYSQEIRHDTNLQIPDPKFTQIFEVSLPTSAKLEPHALQLEIDKIMNLKHQDKLNQLKPLVYQKCGKLKYHNHYWFKSAKWIYAKSEEALKKKIK